MLINPFVPKSYAEVFRFTKGARTALVTLWAGQGTSKAEPLPVGDFWLATQRRKDVRRCEEEL
jgi:hypothetical protein